MASKSQSQTSQAAGIDINWPAAIPAEYPYEPAPVNNNPVLRGWLLYYLAELLAKVPSLQDFFWWNAGFNKLRDRKELEDVEPRHDPTVIKQASSGEDHGVEQDFSALLTEDFATKRPPTAVFPSALDYHEAYKSGNLTPTAVAEVLLPLIRRDINERSHHSTAFLQTRVDLVREAAAASTQRYAQGVPLSPLDGVPFAVKDSADVTGYRKCHGSRVDVTDKRDHTSWCVQQLMDAGAVLLGKCNMHEIGLDTTGNNPVTGTPLNPYNPRYYCGGSSSGSAYAVAAGLMPTTHGADGGGSIRIPANFCGLYGLKPSANRVSKWPTPASDRSVTVEGPIAANMLDLELSYRIMARPNPSDPISRHFPPPRPVATRSGGNGSNKKFLGIYRPWFDRSSAPVQNLCSTLLDHFTSALSYSLIDITIPLLDDARTAHALTILAESACTISPSAFAQLTPANKILVSVGSRSSAIDFLQAQKLRNLLMQHLAHLFESYPGMIIVTPTTPDAGWRIAGGEADLSYGCSDGNASVRSMEYSFLANFAGTPAISVPVGYVRPESGEGRIPVGLMGMAEWCAEEELIAFGYEAERWLEEEGGGRQRPGNWVDVFALAEERMKAG